MTNSSLLMTHVLLADGSAADIRIKYDLIAEIGPGLSAGTAEETLDGGGDLALAGVVDGHMHLDKTLTGAPWMAHQADPTRKSRIKTKRELRASLPPVTERTANLVRLRVSHGTAAIRTHVDVDPSIGLKHVEALLEVRARFDAKVDIQLVAFPQSGVMTQPCIAKLLAQAIDAGAELVGGIDPIAIDDDLDGQFDTLFEIAESKGVGIDIHLHDPGTDGQREIDGVTRRMNALGMAGWFTFSHGFCLGAVEPSVVAGLADAMATAGVSLVTHGGGVSPLPSVKTLRARGVEVFASNDDVRDTWSPLGEGDMLERAPMIAGRSGYRTDEDLLVALDVAGAAGKRALGLDDAGIAVGAPADQFTVAAEVPTEAVARQPVRRLVLKRGRVVARDEVFGG